jgi:hypothetical protein
MSDIRSLLKQTRQSRRITHPYAKYSSQGLLYCTACTQKIASEALWESHIASASHKEKVKHVIWESQQKAKRGIAAREMDDEDVEEEEEPRKRVRIEEREVEPAEPQPEEEAQVGPVVEEDGAGESLPADFFDPGQGSEKKGVDEDEWMRFQAEIAETIRNQEDEQKEDVEELQQGILEEFDELNTFEDRVERLKRRRAELQEAMKDGPAPESTDQKNAHDKEDEDDEDEDVEEDWW